MPAKVRRRRSQAARRACVRGVTWSLVGVEKVASFSEGVEGGSVVEGFKTFLKTLPKRVEFSELTEDTSTPEKDGSPTGAPDPKETAEEIQQATEETVKVFTDYRQEDLPMIGNDLDVKFEEIRRNNPELTTEDAMILAEKSLK